MSHESENVESVSGRLRPQVDLLVGLGLMLLGIVVAIEAYRMPSVEHPRIRSVYSGPGFVPGLLGITLLVFGLLMLIRAIREGGLHFGGMGGQVLEGLRRPEPRRLAILLVLSLGYAWGLIGRVSFPLATFLFMVAFILIYDWGEAADRAVGSPWVVAIAKRLAGIEMTWSLRRERILLVITSTIQAALTAWIVTYVFENIFLRRLP